MKKIFVFLALLIPLFSGSQNTMYFMERVHNNILYNPAFIPEANFNLGLPGIGGVNVHAYNTGFDYNAFDFFYDNLGKEGYNPDRFIRSIGNYNTFFGEAQVNLLSFGFRLRENGYLSFHVNMNDRTSLKAESDLVYLFADFDEIDEEKFPTQVDNLNFRTNNYLSVGLTYSRRINENFTIGISPHINYNVLGIKTDKINYIIDIDEINESGREYDITFEGEAVLGLPFEINEEAINGDELILAAGIIPGNWEEELSISDIMHNRSFSLDLGGTYTLDKWFISASFLNIGMSRWKINGYELKGNNDSIRITGQERIGIGIPPKLYLGITRQFSPKWNYGILLNNSFYSVGANTSATVSLNGDIGDILSTSFSYTFGYKYNNFGLGFRVRFFPGADLYFVTDNLIQIFTYREAYRFSAAFGINVNFGG